MGLLEQIKKPNAKAFTHSGKFHADDVFSSALLLYLNPQITITRGNRVPEEYDGIVFDIGRGRYDHHQRDSRVRENGVPYAAFGLLWEELGGEILGGTLAQRFDEEFVQPLDNNDNTGEKNELATLIGNFNPVWDAQKNIQKEEERISAEPALTAEEKSRGLTKEFQRAVQMAGMILENKFARYRADARADAQIEEVLSAREDLTDTRILVLSEFVPCQKRLKETDIAFVIFPSNRGGYCIQPQKKPDSMNYKCSFPKQWLGLEKEELQKATGLASAGFCHADEQREDEQHEREQHHRPHEQPEAAPDADEVDAHDHRRQPDEIVDGLVVGIRWVGVVEDEQPQRAQEVGQRQQQLIHREEPRQEAGCERARQRYGDGECERLPLEIAQEQKAECADVENRDRPRQRAAGVFQLFTPALAVTRQGNHLAKK